MVSNHRRRDDRQNGQRSALPDLDDGAVQDSEGNDYDEDTLLALQYLRSVRHEANGIPHVMTSKFAGNTTDESNGKRAASLDGADGVWSGYYSDGAYVAAPLIGPTKPVYLNGHAWSNNFVSDAISSSKVAIAYYVRLLQRYDGMKRELYEARKSTLNTDSTAQRLPTDIQWKQSILRGWPSARILHLVPQEMVLNALAVIARSLLRPNIVHASMSEQRRIGAWIWALLGLLRESGTLDGEQIAIVRTLGKHAVALGQHCVSPGEVLAKGIAGSGRLDPAQLDSRELDVEKTRGDACDDHIAKDVHAAGSLSITPVTLDEGIVAPYQDGAAPPEFAQSRLQRGVTPELGSEDEDEFRDEEERVESRRRNSSSSISSAEDSIGATVEASLGVGEGNYEKGHERVEFMGVAGPKSRQYLTAAIDMTITIVGERYGQRDLLSERRIFWEL